MCGVRGRGRRTEFRGRNDAVSGVAGMADGLRDRGRITTRSWVDPRLKRLDVMRRAGWRKGRRGGRSRTASYDDRGRQESQDEARFQHVNVITDPGLRRVRGGA